MRIVGNPPSGGKKPTTPTIGTASDGGTGTTASVAFTPSTYIGKGTITYTATSSPGSITGTGSGSPITVSGLTTGTAYTFTVAGTTNYGVLSDSSAASNSVTPANPASFESIASYTVSGSAVGTIDFASIPQTYSSLQLRYFARSTATGVSDSPSVYFNSDLSANYSVHYLSGNGATISSLGTAPNGDILVPNIAANGAAANVFGGGIIDIHNYASTTQNKTLRSVGGIDANGSGFAQFRAGARYQTAAITKISFYLSSGTSFLAGSTFALYGIKG